MNKKENKEINEEVKDKECKCSENEECSCEEESCDCEECNCDECNEELDSECGGCHCDECDGCSTEQDEEISVLTNYIKELEEKLLREKAELINYRKRKDDEVSNLLKYADEDIVRDLLPTIDNLKRAINMDNLSDEVSKFLSGIKMVYGDFVKILEKYDVKPINEINKLFDPSYHQAVMTEKKENTEPGIVIEVLQEGYLLKDRVIRPAMVKVSE